MKTRMIAVLVLLALVVLASGCTAPAAGVSTTIKSPQEASKAVTNLSTQVDRVASSLDSIDKDLG